MNLSGKTLFITGASRGIGLAIAKRAAADGANVVVVAKTTEAAGASAEVTIEQNAPVTWNDPALTRRMVPTLEWAAGAEQVAEGRAQTVAEDFAYFQQEVPGMYFLLGVNAEGVDAGEAAPNHSPQFHVNEGALVTGVRALTGLAIDYLQPGG